MRSGTLQGPRSAGPRTLQRAGSSLRTSTLHRTCALRRAALRPGRLGTAGLRATLLRTALLLAALLRATLLLATLLRAIALLRAARLRADLLTGWCLSDLRPRLGRRGWPGRRQKHRDLLWRRRSSQRCTRRQVRVHIAQAGTGERRGDSSLGLTIAATRW